MVTFEVARLSAKGGHAHVQVVPVPMKLQDKVEQAFLDYGRQQGIEFEEDPEGAMQSCRDGLKSYFRVDLPGGKKMVHLMHDTRAFSLQFGRFARFSSYQEARLTPLQTGSRKSVGDAG